MYKTQKTLTTFQYQIFVPKKQPIRSKLMIKSKKVQAINVTKLPNMISFQAKTAPF